MTLLSAIWVPKSFEATPATTRFLSSRVSSLAIVAEVPMHRSFPGWSRSRTRRTSSGHVRTLTAAVRVQLVQDEEAKVCAIADDPAVDPPPAASSEAPAS